MSHAIPVFAAIFLCLLAAGLVGRQLLAAPDPGRRAHFSRLDWQVWRSRAAWLDLRVYAWRWTALRWHLMLRARLVRTARPDGPPLIPASGEVPEWRRRGLPVPDGTRKPGPCLPAIGPETLAHMRARLDAPPTRTDLPVPPPRNGVPLQDRPRQTVDMIICDPAVTPVVPRWYQAWLEGRWTP